MDFGTAAWGLRHPIVLTRSGFPDAPKPNWREAAFVGVCFGGRSSKSDQGGMPICRDLLPEAVVQIWPCCHPKGKADGNLGRERVTNFSLVPACRAEPSPDG